MSAEHLARRVLRVIEEKSKSLRVSIFAGAPKDYAEYKRLCGELRGLDSAALTVREQLAHELGPGEHLEQYIDDHHRT